MKNGPWLDFGAEMGFGAQMPNWRAQVGARDRLGAHTRPHAASRGADSANHVGTDRQFPLVRESDQAPGMSERLHARTLGVCRAVRRLCDAVRIRLSGTVRIEAGYVRNGRT